MQLRMEHGSALMLALGLVVCAACANGVTAGDTGDVTGDQAGLAPDAGTPEAGTVEPQADSGASAADPGVSPADGGVVGSGDAAAASKDGGGASKDAGTDSGVVCEGLRINELQADGVSASDEFVELYNPSACTVLLAGYSVGYLSATGNGNGAGVPLVYFTGTASHTIAPHGYFVVAGAGFAGGKDGTLTGGLAAAGGRVGISDAAGKVLDAVGYGTATSGALVEKSAAPMPPTSRSIGRTPNGNSTGDNSADFVVLASTSPGGPN